MASYGVVVEDTEVAGAVWKVTGATGEVTVAGGAVRGSAGAMAITMSEDVALAVTSMLTWPACKSHRRYGICCYCHGCCCRGCGCRRGCHHHRPCVFFLLLLDVAVSVIMKVRVV